MAAELFDHAQPKDRFFRRMMQNMEADEARVEITIVNHVFRTSIRHRVPIIRIVAEIRCGRKVVHRTPEFFPGRL